MAGLRQMPLTCSGHTRPVVHLDFSDHTQFGAFLISACKDGKPMLRRGDTGDWIGTFEGHKGAVWGVALNPDGTKAATGAADFTARLWNAETGEAEHTFQHSHIVKSVDFSRDTALLATGSNEKLVRVYDLNNVGSDPQIFTGHTSNIKHVQFIRSDTCLISCSEDRTVRVWNRVSGQEVQRLDFSATPSSLEVSRDGSVVTVAYGSRVAFYDAQTLDLIREFQVASAVNSASLHPGKSVFVTGGDDFKVYKWDYMTGNEIESHKGHFGPVHCIRFSPDGELYASGSEDGTLRLWQTTVGKTYGLWKCIDGQVNPAEVIASPREVSAQ